MSKFIFSKRSLDNLATSHIVLQTLARKALDKNSIDFTIIEGHRDKTTQDSYYKKGTSGLKWPNSKHNKFPSEAIDIVPYPLDWKDTNRFKELSLLVKQTWNEMSADEKGGYELEWGGDWRTLVDMPHWQLVKK